MLSVHITCSSPKDLDTISGFLFRAFRINPHVVRLRVYFMDLSHLIIFVISIRSEYFLFLKYRVKIINNFEYLK